MLEIFSLKGKRALITGASRGLGYAIAEALASSGAQTILHGRDLGALDRTQGLFAQRGWACTTVTCESRFCSTRSRSLRQQATRSPS